METINLKVPEGTKARLRAIDRNVSALLREQILRLLDSGDRGSAYQKAAHLCGVVCGGPKNASTSRDYLHQYAPKRPN
jgi:hypothetical protein